MSDRNGSYIASDGYLYANGNDWGGGSDSSTGSWYKQTNAGTGIVGYDLSRSYGMVVNSSGVVRIAAAATSASKTWSTVTVGGSTTGHKAVAINRYYQMVVASTGAVYVSSVGETTMTSIAITAAVATANGGVKDISMSSTYQYVLFGNGALYGGVDGSTSMSSIATGVTMFDFEGYNNSYYIYIYNSSNQIRVASAAGSGTHSFTTLVTEAGVKQIRGGSSGWGYINSSNVLKTYESSYNSTSATRTVSNVAYIDCASYGTWGYLNTSGAMYFWASSSVTSVTSNTSPTLRASLGTSAVPDLLGQMTTIADAPPA